MTPKQFHDQYRWVADRVSAATNIDPIALLTQWACETGWGTQWAGAPFNLGNIENNGVVLLYTSLDNFIAACISTWHNGRYEPVLAAKCATDQIAAIIASPWAAGHYSGSLAAFYGPLEEFELTPQEHEWLRMVRSWGPSTESPDTAPDRSWLKNFLDKILAAVPGSGGIPPVEVEPIEPAEPKAVTLHIPAQDISGTIG